MNLLPRQLAQDLLEDDYRSLQNVLMTRSGRYRLFSAPMWAVFFVKIQLDCFSAGSQDVFSTQLVLRSRLALSLLPDLRSSLLASSS